MKSLHTYSVTQKDATKNWQLLVHRLLSEMNLKKLQILEGWQRKSYQGELNCTPSAKFFSKCEFVKKKCGSHELYYHLKILFPS